MTSPTTILPDGVQLHPPPHVSPLDTRSFRALTLANRLSVVLVSDALSERAAASMDVQVGSFSDPPDIPGLAHFLEHMLFLGTVKYPDEASYNAYLSSHGGSSNAYTASENTNFHCELVATRPAPGSVTPPNFREALDRFAQFFIAPAFTESATDRELNAVHSEFEKNLQNDSWRSTQVIKSCANPAHPYSYFNIGSRETLHDTPRRNGIDIRKALLAFHARYYSANLMKLAIVAPYDLDTLQSWVVDLFSEVENRDVDHPWRAYQHIPPLLPDQIPRQFDLLTIKDIRQLEITWLTPSVLEDYRSKPTSLLCRLLGDEGHGSILSVLKARDWGDQVFAGMQTYRTFGMMYVSVTLTKTGVSHVDDIIQLIYEYIRLLRKTGVPEWFFKEQRTVAENAFRFREREGAFGLAIRLADSLQLVPPEDCLSSYLFHEYAPEKISRILDCLTPENGIVSVAGRFIADKVSTKERWFGMSYHVEAIEEPRLHRWRHSEKSPGEDELSLPMPNDLIPTDFTILGKPLPEGHGETEGPCRILRNELMEVHYKLDQTFMRPKAVIVLKFATPLANQSPWQVVMSSLFGDLLEDALTEYSSIAERAGYWYSFEVLGEGVQLSVGGYSHRIGNLLKDVVEKMKGFQADPVRFEMIRDFLERFYVNFEKKPPTSHATYSLGRLLYEPHWSIKDQLECLRDDSVSIEAMHVYSQQLLSKAYMTALVYGNISEDVAIDIVRSVQHTLDFKPLPDDQRPQRRVVKPPLGGRVFSRQAHPNLNDKNSAIEVYYQTEPLGNFPEDVKVDLLASILEDPVFHELRTKQQLGYIVHEGLFYRDSVGGVYFRIQSTVACPDELLRRIDEFLIDVRKGLLETMSDEKFQTYVKALVARRSEPDKTLSSRASRFWGELGTGYMQYDRAEKEIEALHSVTKDEVVQVFDDYIAENGSKRRRIVAQVFGALHPFAERQPLTGDAYEVCNPVAFRRRNTLHALPGWHRPDIQNPVNPVKETECTSKTAEILSDT